MNEYEQRKQRRIERYKARADKARQDSDDRHQAARQISDRIPFGQPILIGHHSEAGHRRDLDRIDGHMRKSVEAVNKAEHYANKAEAAAKNRAISSDDPEALTKLREKLEELEELHRRMKAMNAAHRKFLKDPSYLAETGEHPHPSGLSPRDRERVRNYRQEYSWLPHPFSSATLQNNLANIKRVQERIVELEQRATEPESEPVEGEGFRIFEDKEWGRILIEFDGKPPEDVRKYLKLHGWRWARSRLAWVRHLNGRGRTYAQFATEELPNLLKVDTTTK